MRITINLTEDPGAQTFTVVAPLIGTVQLSLGQKVDRERVIGWTALKNVTVRIVGATEETSPEQLGLFDDPIAKALPVAKKPSGKPGSKKPATVHGSSLKALPEGSPALAIAK